MRQKYWNNDSDGQEPRLELFGLQRSGTSYLGLLLKLNFNMFYSGKAHKHAKFNPENTKVDCIFITRHPYAWLPSFYDLSRRRGDVGSSCSFSSFLKRELTCSLAWANTPSVTQTSSNPITYYCEVNKNWLDINQTRYGEKVYKGLHVKYEDLLDANGLVSQLHRIWTFFDLERQFITWVDVLEEVGPDKYLTVRQPFGSRPYSRKEYYKKQKYIDRFSDEDLAFVQGQIDTSVMNRLGYEALR